MWSYRAERQMAGGAAVCRAAVAELVERVWGARGRPILDDPDGERLDAIASLDEADGTDGWLTWEFTPVPGGTRVRVRLDELDHGPDPAGELAEVLDAIALRCVQSVAAADGDDGLGSAGDGDAPAADG